MRNKLIAILSVIALVLAAPAVAGEMKEKATTTEIVIGKIVKQDERALVLDTLQGHQTFVVDDATVRSDMLADGDLVVLTYQVDAAAGTPDVDEIMLVDEQVEVTEETEGVERRAVMGTVAQLGSSQLILDTRHGREMFVIQPYELTPPLPAPGEKIAVIYRTRTHQGDDDLVATNMVAVPEGTASGQATAADER